MRIAWFSPLPPQPSGISEYTTAIVRELIKYADVDLWTEAEFSETCTSIGRVYKYDDMNMADIIEKLHEYNMVVYNTGNNHRFHSKMYEILSVFPGIVILHDYVMHHFFLGYFKDIKNNMGAYLNMIGAYYGKNTRLMVQKALESGRGLHEREEVFHYPLCEPVVLRSMGVIVHTSFIANKLKEFALCPIKVIKHPHLEVDIEKEEFDFEEGKTYIFIGGEITPNKHVDKVIKAIASYNNVNFLRDKIRVLIVGNDTTNSISKLINTLNVQDFIMFLGRKSEKKFNFYIKNSDICINLRYPTMGESSGVLIRCLQFAKPSIVTKVGFYDEIPDSAVIKIKYGEEGKIPSIIEDYLGAKKHEIVKIGEQGKAYVEKEHSLERYITELFDFIGECKSFGIFDSIFRKLIFDLKRIVPCPKYDYERKILESVSDVVLRFK